MYMSVLANLYVCVPHVASIWQAAFQQHARGRFRHVGARVAPASEKPNKFPGLFPGFPVGIGIWKVLRVTALEINSNKAFVQALFLRLLKVRITYSLESNGSLNMSFAGTCIAAPSSSSGSSVREGRHCARVTHQSQWVF